MRRFLAILVCKLGRFVGKLVGKGSSLPGRYALKICPDILSRVKLPPYVVAVTGSNGKTSTVEMIAAVFRSAGRRVVYNQEGSNQIEGVATTVLSHATLGGVLRADVLLLESDERYAARSFRFFHPTHLAVTNLYRDQLTRNGHPEWVFDAVKEAVHPDTELILNADDPLAASLAQGQEKVKWFRLEECSLSSPAPTGVYHDGAYCPKCKGRMVYRYAHFNHIGRYACQSCGFSGPEKADYRATELDLDQGVMTLDHDLRVHLAFRSVYNVYNILAAYAVCRECGMAAEDIGEVIDHYMLKNGRVTRFTLGAHQGTLLISKHENSVAYDTNLRYVASTAAPCTVMILVDAISRKYYTAETSWLWDIDFDLLDRQQVGRVLLCGRYAADLAVRFSFTAVPKERLELYPDVAAGFQALKAAGDEDVYLLTCFSDRDKALSQVEVEREGA